MDTKTMETGPLTASARIIVLYIYDRLCRLYSPTPSIHQRIAEHKHSSVGKHLLEAHGDKNLLNEGQFCVLKKCH